MRPVMILLVLFTLLRAAAQQGPANVISLREALDLAERNHTLNKTGEDLWLVRNRVKKAYSDLVCQSGRIRLLREQAFLCRDLERVAGLKYKTGDIDLLERSEIESSLAGINACVREAEDGMAASSRQFQSLLLVPGPWFPRDSALIPYAVEKEGNSARNEGLPSGTDDRVEMLYLQLNRIFNKLRYYSGPALDHAELIMKINEARLEKEDIDYVEYTRNIGESFRIRLEYLSILNEYNQTALDLEFYAY